MKGGGFLWWVGWGSMWCCGLFGGGFLGVLAASIEPAGDCCAIIIYRWHLLWFISYR